MTSSQCYSATRDLAVGRLGDLGGFPDCLVPDGGVGIGEGPFGGVEPSGDRGPPLDGDGGVDLSFLDLLGGCAVPQGLQRGYSCIGTTTAVSPPRRMTS